MHLTSVYEIGMALLRANMVSYSESRRFLPTSRESAAFCFFQTNFEPLFSIRSKSAKIFFDLQEQYNVVCVV
jgi:hypothetical protein